MNYKGFPKSICTSVNHVVCHGIPGDKVLRPGDILNVDITVIKDGFHGDTSRMFLIGDASIQARRLCEIGFEAMWRGIRTDPPGYPPRRPRPHHPGLSSKARAIRSCASTAATASAGSSTRTRRSCITARRAPACALEAGMTFTVEPMVNAGRRHVKLLGDGWTVVTKDHSLSAQWEHTVLVTPDGFEVLTLGAADRAAA